MSVRQFEEIAVESLLVVARAMLVAARTAPKGRGREPLAYALATGPTVAELARRMGEIAAESGQAVFQRDADNLKHAPVVVLIGARIQSMGLEVCGMCGFGSCAERATRPDVPCVFNPVDLGIALGSAVSVAADHRVDNRIMYTVGMAAMDLGLLGRDIRIAYGVPLSAGSKNPFFDRT